MKESSGRQACRPILPLYPLQHTLKCALGNGACVLVPKVIPVYGYSHAPQISDITGRFILRGQVNELHPCVPAVCQYEIVFHFACFFSCYEWSVGGVSTATHSKFLYVGDSRAACEPFLYAGHVVFGSDDCRMPVYLRKPRTFIVLHPSLRLSVPHASASANILSKTLIGSLNVTISVSYPALIVCPPSL